MTTTLIDEMKRLAEELGEEHPAIETQVTTFPSGSAMIDVRHAGRAYVMAYSPERGFGVDEPRTGEGLGNHYRCHFADFEAAARKLREIVNSGMEAPTLSLVVLPARDIESTKEFYSLLGLSFDVERHGSGPSHYAAKLGMMVIEIYPSQLGASSGPMRVGFRVPFLDEKVERLRSQGVRIISEPKDSPWGRRAVVEDPDGNKVELTESE